MKTRAIKFLLPVMAIVFAVAASAFTVAHEGDRDENTFITGYIHTLDNPCEEVEVDCLPQGQDQCEYNNSLVYDMDSETTCNDPLFKRQPQ